MNPLHLRLESRWAPTAGRAWVPAEELAALPMGKRDQRLRSLLRGARSALDPAIPAWVLESLMA